MTTHTCERCGHENACGYGSWPDRHPVIATVGGLFALVFMGMMFSIHPVASAVMVALAAVWAAVRYVVRERRRRSAVAVRAEYEHAQLQMRSAPPSVFDPPAIQMPAVSAPQITRQRPHRPTADPTRPLPRTR